MNSFRSVGGMVARLTVGAAMWALAAAAHAAVEKGLAKVVELKGSVEISVDGSQWAPLGRGASLREGAVIRTSAGQAELDLGKNGSRLRILPDSTVALSALTFEETGVETVINTQIDLKQGRVMGHVQKLSAASKYEVRTAKVVAGIRGTRYDISAEGRVVVA